MRNNERLISQIYLLLKCEKRMNAKV